MNEFVVLVTVLATSLCFAKAQLTFYVNENLKDNGSTVNFQPHTEKSIFLDCYYDITLKRSNPNIFEVNLSGENIKPLNTIRNTSKYGKLYIRYQVPDSEKINFHSYGCATTSHLYNIQINLNYTDSAGITTQSTDTTGIATHSTHASGSPSRSTFTGLNPLIYVISAVILLGTLAIVSIITCWIRARRSFNNRIFRPNNTPQDYFDYINDNEFTPLTSSEFAASLLERPPTYVESERIEQDIRTEGSNREGTLSPIPPPPMPQHVELSRLEVTNISNGGNISATQHSAPESETLTGTAGSNDDNHLIAENLSVVITTTVDVSSEQSQNIASSLLDTDNP